jgi:tRNA pseudouridine38-40 synthase
VHAKLPSSIRFVRAEPVAPDFHARFSARGKRYAYRLSERPVDPFSVRYRWHLPSPFDPALAEAALRPLAGRHDFRAFAGKVAEGENPVKTLSPPELIDEGGGDWTLLVAGEGFLYRMVRSIAATVVRVAAGKLPPERVASLLAEARRTPEVHTAPAQGLFLEEVFYP